MAENSYDIGMVGLGVMGRNLVLNMTDHDFSVAGHDKDPKQVAALEEEGKGRRVFATLNVQDFIHSLRKPRAVMMMVPAGVVDVVIAELTPLLEPGDLLIDGGNSHFVDTDRRLQALAPSQIAYLGVGISGGEAGARHGPSMMPGGPPEAYVRVQPVFEAIAAKVNKVPCVTYIGPGSAGHYVKMVHNGIEYGLMQLIAESYDLMKRGLGFDPDRLHEVYDSWNQAELNSYLIEITARIFLVKDPSGQRLIDLILGEARQKGTGMWTAQDAMNILVPIPTIDMAVMMRNLSDKPALRLQASQVFSSQSPTYTGEQQEFLTHLRGAMFAGMILTYAQGFAQLREASEVYKYQLNLEAIARIWRGGCIIRAELLEEIRAAYSIAPDLINLILDPRIGKQLAARIPDLRFIVHRAVEMGLPVPGLMASLAYFDASRSKWLPANLIQAQRDYFGAHTYRRIDEEGVFHTVWEDIKRQE